MHNDHMAVTESKPQLSSRPAPQICSAALFPFPRIANKHLIAPSLTFLAPPSTRISQSCCFLAEPMPTWEVQQIGVPTSLCELRPLVFPRVWSVVGRCFPTGRTSTLCGSPWGGVVGGIYKLGLRARIESPKYASTTQSECIRSEISTASLPSP
jgi:hypothetical protein